MTSRKRNVRSNVTMASEVRQMAPSQPTTKGQKHGACLRCRKRKLGCQYAPGASVCQRCTDSGHANECVPAEGRTRSNDSALPLPSKDRESTQPESQKHTRPAGSPSINRQTKRRRKLKSPEYEVDALPPPAPQFLDPIPEFNYRMYQDDEGVGGPSDMFQGAGEFISALSAGGPGPEGVSTSDVNEPEVEQGSGEEIDINNISTDDDSSSDDLDRNIARYIERNHPKAQANGVPVKQPKSSAEKIGHKSYDPLKCPFTIQATARQPSGTNSPFQVTSEITLNELRTAVARKLGRFPDHVQLRYRLDNDKAKDGMISIQNDDELTMFKDRMRDLIVPPRLSNGKPSTRPLKKVLVHFEDASAEDQATGSSNSKAGASSRTAAQGKQKAPVQASGQLEGGDRLKELIAKLQERWKCKTHTKGVESPVYCYPASDGVCYPLTHANLSLWALEIMSDSASIDEKPLKLIFQDARPRTRSVALPATQMPQTMPPGFPTPAGPYGYPPPSVIVLPPWGMPLGYQGAGQMFPSSPYDPSSTHLTRSPSPMPSSLHTRSPSPFPGPSTSTQAAEIPDIISWFAYLDSREERQPDDPTFTQFGPILKDQGFLRLSQLSLEYFGLADLQKWLGIGAGTAVLIMQYAKEDLAAIRSGRLVPPKSR
ncbi:hypothetical protein BDN67DRAFT_1013216 [Paxillus ammoniavirescens]|nr:hypothetical protein BDN67DRAFT_1013216 [Paxillus ammoniavirescens]